jgi:hypothetical protein
MEQVTNGITREHLFNGRVVLYTVEGFNVSAFIKWSQVIGESFISLPKDHDYLAVHDLSKAGMSLQYLALTGYNVNEPWLTQSNEKRFLDLQKARPTMNTMLAIIMSSQLSGQLAMRRARGSISETDRIETRTFDDREMALQWISGFVPERNAQP